MPRSQGSLINDCCFGEDLASWLRDRLHAKGLQTAEPYQEDWGWEFSVKDSAGSYYIGVGGNPIEGAGNKNHGEWRLIISKRRSLWYMLTGRNKIATDEAIIARVFSVLKAESDFSNIHTEE